MAYSAQQEGSNYAIYQDGNRISTGTAATLGNYGLSADNLGSTAPAPTGIGATTSQPVAQTPSAPAPQQTTPSAPTININNAPQTTTQPAPTSTQTQQTSQSAPPTTNLQPGAQGQDVQNLQNYLVQMGYLTPEQVSTGPGTYGPQTTAAVAKLQNDLGIQAGSGAGYYGPQTQQALSQKYQGLFSSMQGSQTPDTGAAARAAMQGALDQASSANNPVFGSLSAAMAPIMQSLVQVLNNVNNPTLGAVSLQQEYNQLREQYQLPEMNAQLMNMQNIMNGSEQDIRDEVTKAGGFATDSQVQAMATSRNKVILKQFNALSTQYSAAQQNVQSMMQYAGQDQSTQLQRSQISASITESLASIQNQMLTMGMTMQNNAKQAAQYNVSQMGYQGLAKSLQGNPQMLSSYESLLGLAQGTLSNPQALAAMDTYKDQSLQLSNYKAAVAAYSAGYQGPSPFNNGPMTPSNPNGIPQGPGTQAVADNSLIQPNQSSNDILSASGLSLIEFNYLTQGTSALSRYSQGQRMAINNSVTAWAKSHNVDVATIQSQYEAYNKTLQSNISRFNNTKIAENEVTGTLQNLDPAAANAGLGDVNLGNVAKIFGGQQVNDPKASEYVFYFNDLINSLAYFYAAQQGKSSADIPDKTEAAKVIQQGISSGGIQGLQTAVNATTKKMEAVLGQAVDSSHQDVWDLLGVGDRYQSTQQQSNQSYQVEYGGVKYNVDSAGNMTPSGSGIDFNAIKFKSSFSSVGGDTHQASNIKIPQNTLAYANNNPGNLKYAGQTGATQGRGGFAAFKNAEEGFNALMNQIRLDSRRGLTLSQFISKFAPPTENNTNLYIRQIMASTGASPSTPISRISTTTLARAIAQKESSTKFL